jgi:hypothetical protein
MAWDYSPFEKSEVKARLAAILFALTWAVFPGFGLIDLSVTAKPGEFRAVVPVDAGWGLLTTVLLAGAFAWSAVRPRHFAVAAVQLVVVAVALVVSSIAGSESGAFVLAAFVLIEVSVLATLLPRVTDVGFSISVSWPLAATAAIGAGPWLAYAGDMWAANREGRAPEEITIAINHWAVQGGLALAIASLADRSTEQRHLAGSPWSRERGSPDPLANPRPAQEIRSTRCPKQDLRGAPGW